MSAEDRPSIKPTPDGRYLLKIGTTTSATTRTDAVDATRGGSRGMIEIVWEFVVKPDAVQRFERSYGPRGDWARLFERYPGYRGTTLLRDAGNARRFLTIDRWDSEGAFSPT